MNVLLANLEDLLQRYYSKTPAKKAEKHLNNLIEMGKHLELANLLRDYRQRAVYSPEQIELRSATDSLLNCCSALEIASIAGFIPDVTTTGFAKTVRPILQNKTVRRYYEEYYPTKLPQLFRYRLTGIYSAAEAVSDQDVAKLVAFFDLDRRFVENLDGTELLLLLDSFAIEGIDFDDVVEALRTPQAFIDHLLHPPKKRDVLSRAINQLGVFVQFCFDLRLLLTELDSRELLQSAAWHHYSYWFDIIGEELDAKLGRALCRFCEWQPIETDQDQARKAQEDVQAYVREAQNVLRELTSGKYATPVSRCFAAAYQQDRNWSETKDAGGNGNAHIFKNRHD